MKHRFLSLDKVDEDKSKSMQQRKQTAAMGRFGSRSEGYESTINF